MKLELLIERCGLESVVVPDPQVAVEGVYTSDLLSDVVAHCPDGAVLITVQNHKNSIAVCTLVGAPALIVTHQREIPADMLEAARSEGVAILRTAQDQFSASLRLGKALGIDAAP